ncbi:hypothetical protein PAAG_12166 [Paracoccidioides lutzii Pb01]|uniref:Uncharacterized protein n=1 Tax=Paracoccidioides lutzii (strain ATCC MYA-826 / Pb01) TaxID=502779 RepID=A0A0A2V0V9_PARBA|nr:hypothetical protein PAAG_12166 [Paracoccidioides lutzii Pb01]KGQ01128.1 hypothetical protein PAAG_12166 [Paracoccidioides lutzii Pb01]
MELLKKLLDRSLSLPFPAKSFVKKKHAGDLNPGWQLPSADTAPHQAVGLAASTAVSPSREGGLGFKDLTAVAGFFQWQNIVKPVWTLIMHTVLAMLGRSPLDPKGFHGFANPAQLGWLLKSDTKSHQLCDWEENQGNNQTFGGEGPHHRMKATPLCYHFTGSRF